ncbi:hypothetical protein NA57DRAFT_62333 [Rhizodiscina lignyota]|uniref:Uncharacterized protein n=1 Tax=Rhizodiscina lignyota TaxID=1504668 RepID=A0A9P4M2T6_9PEZI|nr:hypothetical protein NA57DRAFT_62333 [Rhizodiscina lignyota]
MGNSQSKVTPFRLLDLPVEVRLGIYEFDLYNHLESVNHNYIHEFLYEDVVIARMGCEKQPPITSVCRQLRSEALPLYYSKTKFWVPILARNLVTYPYLDDSDRWFSRIGPQNRSMLRHISMPVRFDLASIFNFGDWDPPVVLIAKLSESQITITIASEYRLLPGFKAEYRRTVEYFISKHGSISAHTCH